MRSQFSQALYGLMEKKPQLLFLTGDLGFQAFEKIQTTFGPRFINAGVAEQNMMGMAAGMSVIGFQPWVYSISPFITLRCLEQIRNDIALPSLPVKLVGNGAGFSYGVMGPTHHALEDLGVLKNIPGLELYFPVEAEQVYRVVDQMQQSGRPGYLRLGLSIAKTPTPYLNENPHTLTRQYRKGAALTVLSVGHITGAVLTALAHLPLDKFSFDLFSLSRFPFLAEMDPEVCASIERNRKVLVIEEHFITGGLAESMRSNLPDCDSYHTLGVQTPAKETFGSAAYHLEREGLSPHQIAEKIKSYV